MWEHLDVNETDYVWRNTLVFSHIHKYCMSLHIHNWQRNTEQLLIQTSHWFLCNTYVLFPSMLLFSPASYCNPLSGLLRQDRLHNQYKINSPLYWQTRGNRTCSSFSWHLQKTLSCHDSVCVNSHISKGTGKSDCWSNLLLSFTNPYEHI